MNAMKSNIKNIILIGISLLLLPICLFSQGQPFFSENWNNQGGETAMFYKNATVTDNQRNIYVAGATINGSGNHDILIQKLNPRGDLIWEVTYNGYANMDDASADIFVDNQLNVYVTGTTIKNPTNAQDLIVLKYDKTGTLKWEYIYDNNGNSYGIDVGTAITGDNNGSLYVTGSSFGTNTQADYVTIRLNSDNGNKIWEQRYDYAGLNEIPAKIIVKGNDLYVSGASQVSSNKWELATLFYKASNGTLLGARRSVGNATHGVNEITDITLDNVGNIYLTGAVQNTNSYDIAVYKLDDELNILWEVHYDAYGDDDKGNGIKVDGQGNVYVAGTISTQNEGKNFVLLKYNSSGVLQWEREFNGRENGNDEAAQLTLYNDYIYITGLAKNSLRYSFQTLVYKTNGDLYTQAEYTNVNDNEKPTGITTDLSGDIIIVGQTELSNGNYRTRTIKYSLYEKPFEPVFENGKPKYNANEIIIRFDRSAVNYFAIDRKGFIAGQLDEFVKPNVITELNNKLGMNVARFPTFKIFRRMTTADTLSISRLGDTVKVDDFWATLSVMFPKNVDVEEVNDSLKTINIIHYSEKNKFGTYQDGIIPNDPKFSLFIESHNHYHVINQTSLTGSVRGIDMVKVSSGSDPYLLNKGAWEFEVGKPSVKVGVFDTGVNWRHEDLGDGSWGNSVVVDGWDYGKGVHPSTQTNSDPINTSSSNGHGTAVAGIIGAIRNNDTGIAGIAGGDLLNNEKGISLLTLRTSTGEAEAGDTLFTITTASEAIVEGAIYNPLTDFGFGLDIQNYSWRILNEHPEIDTILFTLRKAVHCAYKNNAIQVASSGNLGFPNKPLADTSFFPASFNDEWILKIGAYEPIGIGANSHKERVDFSVFGPNLDILAPGINSDIYTLGNNYQYRSFSGTSASAPHVSGVAALLLSMHNPMYQPLYPNKLSMEDVEYLIKKNASPITKDWFEPGVTLPSPNKYSGHGALDAYNTLKMSSLPYKVYHFNHKVSKDDGVLIASNQSIEFIEGINNLPLDVTIGTTSIYKISGITNHELGVENVYIDGWIRNSSSDLYNLTDTLFNTHWSGTKLISSSINDAEFEGYFYETEIITPDSTYTMLFPEPDSQGKFNIAYSIYVKDSSIHLGVDEEYILSKDDLLVYPNPSNNVINIRSENAIISSIEVYDISGKLIKSQNYKSKEALIDISNFSNGVYFLSIERGENRVSRKVIKY